MKNVIFTICAKNYIGLSQVLERSVIANEKDVNFYIIVADELDDSEKTVNVPSNILFAKDILDFSECDWYNYAFKYDLTEFCTFLKPYCFSYFFTEYGNNVKVIYFDPDIFVYNKLNVIWEALKTKDICITPHITTSQEHYTGDLPERNLLSSGLYNCGFIAIKNHGIGRDFVKLWQDRLVHSCFRSESESMFTDQRWVDFIPSLYPQDSYKILFDLGCNLAPWNFYERELVNIDGQYKCRNRILKDGTYYNLIFVHYSGYNYQSLIRDKVSQQNITTLEHSDDLNYIFDTYRAALSKSEFNKYSHLKYSYNYFCDGNPVLIIHRRFYRRLLLDKKLSCDNPFGKGDFYNICKKRKLLLNINLDKMSRMISGNVDKHSTSLYYINCFLLNLYRLIGIKRMNLLLKFFRLYSKYENNLFIIDKSYLRNTNLMR